MALPKQNVGMIIRSAVAAGIDGVLYPQRGIALSTIVIKPQPGRFSAHRLSAVTPPYRRSVVKKWFSRRDSDAHATGSL